MKKLDDYIAEKIASAPSLAARFERADKFWDTIHRVETTPILKLHEDVILEEWHSDHYRWVAAATTEEILLWVAKMRQPIALLPAMINAGDTLMWDPNTGETWQRDASGTWRFIGNSLDFPAGFAEPRVATAAEGWEMLSHSEDGIHLPPTARGC